MAIFTGGYKGHRPPKRRASCSCFVACKTVAAAASRVLVEQRPSDAQHMTAWCASTQEGQVGTTQPDRQFLYRNREVH